jgi:hypothetical protein
MAMKKTVVKSTTVKKSNGGSDDEKRRKKLENTYAAQNKGAKPPKGATLVPSSETNFQNGTGAYKVYVKATKPAANASKVKSKAPVKKTK